MTTDEKPGRETAPRAAAPRARQRRSQATGARILDAAAAVFAEHGYERAHLAAIAERSGHSIGAVYGRFADKDALFRSVIARMGEGLLAALNTEIDRALERGELTRAVIRRFIALLVTFFARERGLIRAIVERSFHDAPLAETIRRLREIGLLRIEEALGSGGLSTRKSDLKLATAVMQQMLFGYLVLGLLNQQALLAIDDPRGIDELTDALAAYLGAGE